jgi:hypothetical protein
MKFHVQMTVAHRISLFLSLHMTIEAVTCSSPPVMTTHFSFTPEYFIPNDKLQEVME